MSQGDPVRVEQMDDEPDACRVIVDAEGKEIVFQVERLMMRRSDINSTVTVDWHANGSAPKASFGIPTRALAPQNINWRSVSAIKDLTQRLENYYGKDLLPWRVIVEMAASAVDAYIRRPLAFNPPTRVTDTRTSYLLRPFMPSSGVTIFFGPGDAGKGYLLCSLLYLLGHNEEMFDVVPDGGEGPIYYLDYEDSQQEWDKRLTRIGQGLRRDFPKDIYRIDGRGVPFAEQADTLLAQMGKERPRALIIDSAMPAAGGDIIRETEPVRHFFAAASRFKCPIGLIAHETKSDDGDMYPFGSAFWHYLARWTVNVRGSEHLPLERHILLRHRKHNSGPRFKDLGLKLTFSDDEAGESPEWTKLESMKLKDLTSDLQDKRSAGARIADLMGYGVEMDVATLVNRTGATADAVRKALQRGPYHISDGGKGEASLWIRN